MSEKASGTAFYSITEHLVSGVRLRDFSKDPRRRTAKLVRKAQENGGFNSLTSMERYVLRARFGEDIFTPYWTISDKLKIPTKSVRKLERQALRKIRSQH